jgi:biotin-(acetyl-CoA carboxylase) ligase
MQPQTKPSLQREWRQVTAKVNGMIRSAFYDKALAELEPFLKLCEQQGVTDLIPLVEEKIVAVKKELGKRSNNTEEIAKLKRDWRPLKASSNGKIRIGKAQEAKAEFEAFLKRCEKVDAKDLIAEVKVELDKIPTTPPPPPLPLAGDLSREWRNLKATSNGKVRSGKAQDAIKEFEAFLKKCEQTGAKDLITLVKAEIAKAKGDGSTTPPPPPVTSPTNGGSLVREWKQTKAAASGKIRAQKNAEAKKILQDFLAKCTAANSKDIIAEVKAELAKVK